MSDDGKKMAIAVPGEWALEKTLGPVLSEIGEDLKKLYAKGRDNIIAKAYKKMPNPEDGKSANLRIAHDVLVNGAFTDEEICAEYFGGILASSRTDDGKNDDGVQFVDVVKSLSSRQLHLHYIIYNRINKLFVEARDPVNVAMGKEIEAKKVWFSGYQLRDLGVRIDVDFNVLHRQGLIHSFETNNRPLGDGRYLPYAWVTPTSFGVLLYAIAHNRLAEWLLFNSVEFGDFEGIEFPTVFGLSLDPLLKAAGVPAAK